jgi:hypothetical protein
LETVPERAKEIQENTSEILAHAQLANQRIHLAPISARAQKRQLAQNWRAEQSGEYAGRKQLKIIHNAPNIKRGEYRTSASSRPDAKRVRLLSPPVLLRAR